MKPLLDAYFLQCRLVAAQPEAASSLKLAAGRVEGVLGDTAALEKAATSLPIAAAESGRRAHLVQAVPRPRLRDARGAAFRKDVAARHRGRGEAHRRRLEGPVRQGRCRAGLAGHLDASPVKGLLAELPTLADADLEAIEAASKADLALKDELDAVSELSASSSTSAGC
ncbi:MAG: hypothetical protein QM757_36355 [Paludibaculum sp.]